MHAWGWFRKSVGIFCVLLSCATWLLAEVSITQVSSVINGGSPIAADLTAVGVDDWRDWGTGTWSANVLVGEQRSGGSDIGNLTRSSTPPTEQSATDGRISTTWTDGTPTLSKSNDQSFKHSDINNGAASRTYSFNVTAPSGTLYVYAAGYWSSVRLTVDPDVGTTQTLDFEASHGIANTWGVVWKVEYTGGPLTMTLGFDPDVTQQNMYSTFGLKAAALEVTATPSIAGGSFSGPLSTTFGTSSSPQTVNVTGADLTANLVATAPAGLEVSIDDITYGDTAEFVPGSGSVDATLYVRLKATAAAGTYNSQDIELTSTGATPVNIPTTAADNMVSPAALTMTADNRNKTHGNTLTGGTGYPHFTVGGGQLKNGNTVTSVTVSYTGGDAAGDSVGVYPDAIDIASAVGANGFNAGNYSITYVKGTLTVIAATVSITQVDSLVSGVFADKIDVDLTDVGVTDWRDWGTGTWSGSTLTGVKKADGTKFGNLTRLVDVDKNVNDLKLVTSWTDGDPTATHAGNRDSYLCETGQGPGVYHRFTVAGANDGNLYVYAVGWNSFVRLTVEQQDGPTETALFSGGNSWGVIWKVEYSGAPLTVTLDFDPDASQPHGDFSSFGIKAAALEMIKAAPLATLVVNNSPVTYDGAPKAATVQIDSSSVPGTVTSILTGGAATQTGADTYVVTANFVPDDEDNYETLTAQSAGNFVIAQKALTITADDKSKTFDGNVFSPFTASYDGFVAGEDESVLGGTLTFGGAAATATAVGIYTDGIVPGGLTSDNYDITFVPGTLTIEAIYSGTLITFR